MGWIAFRFSLLMFLLGGILYPLSMVGLGQWLFPEQANGSLIKNHQGQVIGSKLLGQAFHQPEYFHSRPSAVDYDAVNSGGSNDGMTNAKFLSRLVDEARTYQVVNQTHLPIPQDAVTASGSGLDPHISFENALAQRFRIARMRNLDVGLVENLIQENAKSECGIMARLSETCGLVRVLKLNLALDKMPVGANAKADAR